MSLPKLELGDWTPSDEIVSEAAHHIQSTHPALYNAIKYHELNNEGLGASTCDLVSVLSSLFSDLNQLQIIFLGIKLRYYFRQELELS